MRKLLLAAAAVAALALGGSAGAANTLIGGATANADGSITLSSTAVTSAGIDFGLPSATNFGDVTSFSMTYTVPAGCPSGTPILAINTVRGTIWAPLGLDCSPGTHTAFVGPTSSPLDTSAILGGTALDNWGHAKGEYDNLRVNSIQLVTTGANQSVVVSNTNLVITPGAASPSL
jgi:hypothetical protein